MHMKKLLMALLMALLLMLGVASAETGRTGSLKTVRMPDLVARADSNLVYNVPSRITTGQPVNISVSGGRSGYTYCLAIGVDWTDIYQYIYDADTSSSFTYTFYEPGSEYVLFVMDSMGNTVGWKFLTVTGTDYVQAKVNEIIAGCPAGDDYTKAVYLHDYLASNSYYDDTMVYHGRDHLLVDGYGVCQSFSEAYKLLCETMGIRAEIVTSWSMGHEWNAIQMNGKWYETDVTWDTPASEPAGTGSPAGYSYHAYFGVPDEIMSYDHYGHNNDSDSHNTSDCVNMDDNYFVRSGDAATWMNDVYDDLELNVNNLEESFTLTIGDVDIDDGQAWYRYDIAAAATAAAMNGMRYTGSTGAEAILTASHVPNSSSVRMSRGISVTASYVEPEPEDEGLILPDDLVNIDDYAFYGTDCQFVSIPLACETIGSKAFANCPRLHYVYMTENVKLIQPDAFEGSPKVCLMVTPGTYAGIWAEEHNVEFEFYMCE